MAAELPEKIEELKKSPLFNLSLSSKELFHSNFLAWLCETFPEEVGKILSEKFNWENTSINKDGVKREKGNLDLIIELGNKKIIIENKVKSIPRLEQLKKYYDKNKKGSEREKIFILLTLMRPTNDLKSKIEKMGWKIWLYEDLGDVLTDLNNEIKREETYARSILNDYIGFIKNLFTLTADYCELPETFNMYEHHKEFQKVRFHDVYTKLLYSQLKEKIYSKLIDDNIRIHMDTPAKDVIGELIIYDSYVRGKGFIAVEFRTEENLNCGIMIDGNRYLQFIWGENDNEIEPMIKSFKDSKKWFYFDKDLDPKSYPRGGKEFNKFGKVKYRSVNISKETTIKELLKRISEDVAKMKELDLTINSEIPVS